MIECKNCGVEFPAECGKYGCPNCHGERWQERLGGPKLPPKDKAAMMARLRRERKEAGLVELRIWLKPEQKKLVDRYIEKLTADK